MNTNSTGVPVAIVIGGLLIGAALMLQGGSRGGGVDMGHQTTALEPSEFRGLEEGDHVRGNPDGAITLVEFSDLECPFCARLHPTIERVVQENDDVAWVYRHFPLSTIHPRALSAAVASECVARLGTNENFWTFVDDAFEAGHLSAEWYEEKASAFGIDSAAFEACMEDRSVVADIQNDLDEATGIGGRGTPYVVIVAPSGQLMPFSGALSYEQVSVLVADARNN